MKTITYILSILLAIVLFVGLFIGYKIIEKRQPTTEEVNPQPTHEIIVNDEIKIYVGQDNYISPYLISDDGTVEISRFDYSSSSDSVSVDYSGLVTLHSIPKEEVHVTITERNTGAKKTVKLNIIQSLESVLGLIAPDGNLIQGSQKLYAGYTYAISVITEPAGMSIENHCTVITSDHSGVQKQVFDISYDGDKVLLTVVGLGDGVISIRVVNDKQEEIYSSKDIEFHSAMTDETLTEKIIEQSGVELLSKDELEAISSIVVDESISDLASLKALPSLKTVLIDSESVLTFENLSADYSYRVPEALFYDYCSNGFWTEYKNELIPFDSDFGGSYIVYHSDRATEIAFEKLYSDYVLNVYEATGYENVGWTDENGAEITGESLGTISSGSIHVYAVWEPIKYYLVYHFRDFDLTFTDTWTYETVGKMKNNSEFGTPITRAGYRFAGWTDNGSESIFSTNVKYDLNGEYTALTDKSEKKINLYDLWEPIEYTIVFNTPEDATEVDDVNVVYGKAYNLPETSRSGYRFLGWKTSNGTRLSAGMNDTNLTTTDGYEVVLTPIFEEIGYTIVFDLDGGTAPLDNSIVTGAKVKVGYTEHYTLPTLTKQGYTVYSWVCEENGKTYQGTETLYKEFGTECTVSFKAVWSAAVYSINYDCNGGVYEEQESFTAGRYWNDGTSLVIPTREGYTFAGWKDEERQKEYVFGETDYTANLISSTDENGAVFNLKAVWTPNEYNVLFDPNGAPDVIDPKPLAFDSEYGELPVLIREGYTFGGWYLGDVKINASTKVSTAAEHTLVARWIPLEYKIAFDSNGGTSCESITVYYDQPFGSLPSPTRSNRNGDGGHWEYSFASWMLGDISVNSETTVPLLDPVNDNVLVARWNEKWVEDPKGSCLVKGSLIMLPDGSFTAIENLGIGDSILTFDHTTGNYVESQIAFTFYAYNEIYVISLQFENGNVLKMANGGHGVFDTTLNQYVLITPDNVANYIGHKFSFVSFDDGQFIQSETELVSYEITIEMVERYDIATSNQLNHIAEGILSCSDTLVGICNVFDFTEEMTYDTDQLHEDVEKYGLYTYEEWSEYVTYEEFVAFNGQYFKISIEKGLMTEADLLSLINDLRNMWE